MAGQGIRCTAGYVSHPYCSPSRAGLVSGRYQQSFGHEHNPPYDETNSDIGIDVDTRLLPEIVAEAGYQTGIIGKWHLGAGSPFRPMRRGFSEFYGFLGGGHHYFETRADGLNYDSPMWRGHKKTDDNLTYLTDDLTNEARAFIKRNRENPFCLLLMYNAPHAPDHVKERYESRVDSIKHPGRRRYAALVQGIDEGVKRIMARLDEYGLRNNTLTVFLSDNGGRAGVSDNRPLRGNKGWLHEGGIRVPMILSMPGTLAAGRDYDKPVSALDLLPTAMALSDIEIPADCDGVDLLPYLNGTELGPPHDTLFWRVCGGQGVALREGNWKLVHDVGMDHPGLYDLSKDVGEDTNLARKHPELVNRLRRKFDAWSEQLEQPRWTENHLQNTTRERARARVAGTRQAPMDWLSETDR